MLYALVKLSVPLTFVRKPHICGPTQDSTPAWREMLTIIKHARNRVLVVFKIFNFIFVSFFD